MKISASLYSSNNHDLPSLVHELEALHLDYFHIDCFEGQEKKVGKDVIAIQSFSKTPIDLHAITSQSDLFFTLAKEWKVKQLTLQYENLKEDFSIPKEKDFLFGLALVNETDLEELEKYQEDLDYILLMTTTPGKSGGKFHQESFERIRKCKELYPNLPIYVDGGINGEISFILRLLGVSMAVSGSFLVNNDNIAVALADLRFHQKGSHFLMEDFMLIRNKLPVLNLATCSFKEVVQQMEDSKMGFVLFEENKILKGICSNADLRKGILKNIENLDQLKVSDLVNFNPITISNRATSYEMLSLIKEYNFPILFLPVVNAAKQLKGVITFNELIKGEG